MRQVALTTSKGGITRLRTKGAALNDSLFDLENGYVTAARTIRMRPGTRRLHELPPGTKGCVGFRGLLWVFSTTPVMDPPEGIEVVVLRSPDGADREIAEIHFAEPFLGFLYVVAEFDDGNVYHYWLQDAQEWSPDTVYAANSLVRATVDGSPFVFRASRADSPNPVWLPGVARQIGDKVEPTVYNGFFYEAVAVTGASPRSGNTEPLWPTSEGAQVVDSPDITPAPPPAASGATPPPTGTSPEVQGRYSFGDIRFEEP